MKVYLLDINIQVVNEWQKLFNKEEKVFVVLDDFKNFMDNNDIDCVVSPGNSKGIMAGGYDRAISEYFGWDLTNKVQKFIVENFNGSQPVGTSQIFEIDNYNQKLIHTPTMLYPSAINDYNILYDCTKNTLDLALNNNIKSIVLPAFGGACGKVPPDILAQKMYEAYKDFTF